MGGVILLDAGGGVHGDGEGDSQDADEQLQLTQQDRHLAEVELPRLAGLLGCGCDDDGGVLPVSQNTVAII